MGIQWFEIKFLAIFSISRESIESRSKLAIKQIASSLVISNHSDWSKVLWARFFYVSTPFLLVVAAAAVGVVNQEVASMELQIGQRVA